MNTLLHTVKKILARDAMFSIALLLAAGTFIFARPGFGWINWTVLLSLFNLSAVLLALEKYNVFDRITVTLLSRSRNRRAVSLILIAVSFAGAMAVTNDVALLVLVPLTITIARRENFDPAFIIILETLAANIGSSLTPTGNPQNLFLFTHYHLQVIQLVRPEVPFVLAGLCWLFILNNRVEKVKVRCGREETIPINAPKTGFYLVLFGLTVLSVLRILDYRIVFALVLSAVVLLDRDILARIDYPLLGTFACIFMFVGGLTGLPLLAGHIRAFLNTSAAAYFSSIALSQLISNVPSAILLAGFTRRWEPVLLGVNVGGMGTLLASLASLISYRFYVREYGNRRYLYAFLGWNLLSLVLFSGLVYAFILRPGIF